MKMKNLGWVGYGICLIAAAIAAFAPTWLFIGLEAVAMTVVSVGLWYQVREAKRQARIAEWDRIFGIPDDRKGT